MSEKVPVILDMSQAEGELANFARRVEMNTLKASRRVLGTLATIAAATGTTVGKSISLVISGAITSAQLLQAIGQSQLSNVYTAAFGALTLAQVGLLWDSIFKAIGEQSKIEYTMATTNTLLAQFNSAIGWL